MKIDKINKSPNFPSLFKQLSNLEWEKQIVYLDPTKRFITNYIFTKYTDSLNVFINPTEHLKNFSYDGNGGVLEIRLFRTIADHRYEDFVNRLLEPYSNYKLQYHPFLKPVEKESIFSKKLNAICNGKIFLLNDNSLSSEKKVIKGHYYFDLSLTDSNYEYNNYQQSELKKIKIDFQIPHEWKDILKNNPKKIIFCATVEIDSLTMIPKYVNSVMPLLIIDQNDNLFETIEGFQFDHFEKPPCGNCNSQASGSNFLVDYSEIIFESRNIIDEKNITNFFTQSLIEYFQSEPSNFNLIKRFDDGVIFNLEKKKSVSILNGDYGLIRINAKVICETNLNRKEPDKVGITIYIDWSLYVSSHPANKFGEPNSWQLQKFNTFLDRAKASVLQKMCEKYSCNKSDGKFKINIKNGKK